MYAVLLKAWCLFVIFLRCGWCQSNSSDDSLSGSGDAGFPIIVLGKDESTLWYANVSFGTPNVQKSLRVDIGQPYTWLLKSLNGSETAVRLNDGHVYDFNFMDGIDISGPAVMDTMNFTALAFPGENVPETHSINLSSTAVVAPDYLSISNISFFEANASAALNKGSLGLGGKITDQLSETDSTKFDSSFFFLDRLTDLGIIASPSYSLWFGADNVPYSLRKLPSGTLGDCGKLILGAVDPTLFTGRLHMFKTIPYIDPETHLESSSYPILPLGTIYINSATGKSLNVTAEEFVEPVLLDSRYSTSYLPIDAIIQIAVQIGATYVEALGRWVVACSVASYDVQLDFSFGDMSIRVPLEDFLVTTFDVNSNTTIHFSNGAEACLLAMGSKSTIGFNILGGPFLKNAYTVFDLEDNAIALAQAKKVDSSSSSSASSSEAAQTSTSASAIRAISSGHIPYAESRNTSMTMTLIPAAVPSATSNIPDIFTGTIDSDGLISTGRSFYQTSRTTPSSKTSETAYESLVISSIVSSSKYLGGATKNNAGHSSVPACVLEPRGKFPRQVLALLLLVLLAVLL
ncbi:hypothetical protein HG536_0E00630 [Torulaspora globosa]|uniref:Peptidase A1 domain-containing protein n=1 Tax=Torulaspora globosa TaxID=48254 RepID=A0A7G3ZI17_9SACH|nr:uncharacterized protein HG536_0E00630 [Torulaspora globosa]QLL33153.1 hypothetical protein HG536_0E00630 [Torulaspora globosa]